MGSGSRAASARILGLGIGVLLCAHLLITSTVSLSATFWLYDVKRFLQLSLLPVFFLVVLLSPPLRQAFSRIVSAIPHWLGIVLLAIVALGVLSSAINSAWGIHLLYSLADVFLLVLLVVAALCVAACRAVAGPLFDRTMLVLLAMLSVAVGLQELLGVLAAWNSGIEFHHRVALLHFSWPRFYNQVQSWSLPVIAALPLVLPRKPLVKLLCLLALALGWYVIIATGGRGSAVAISGAVLIAAVVLPTARKALLGYHLLGLLLGVLVYALVVVGHGVVLDPSRLAGPETPRQLAEPARQANSAGAAAALPAENRAGTNTSGTFLEPVTGSRMLTSSGRTAMWRGSLRDTRRHPLLGIGPMNYACQGPTYRAAHPHSFPLQFVSEWGIPAFGLLLLALARLAWTAAGKLRNLSPASAVHPALPTALATGLLAAAIHACLSGVLIMPASQVCGVLVAGWFLAFMATERRPARSPNDAGTRAGRVPAALPVLLVSLALALGLLTFAQHELAQNATRLEETPMMDRLIPRLWQNGKVCTLYSEKA